MTQVKTKNEDIKALVTQIIDTFQPSVIKLLQNQGITRDHIWLAVARFTLNKKELCDDDCDGEEGVHFHDSDDWFGVEERKILDEFWHKLKSGAKTKAQKYVDELVEFTNKNGPTLAKLIHNQTESTREFLETIINKDSKEFIESLLVADPGGDAGDEKTTEKDVTKTFPFVCAVVCMLMDYHDKDDDQEATGRLETGWFETFFQYFLADHDDDEEDSDEDESDEEDDEDDEEDEEEDEEDDEEESEEEESEEEEQVEKKVKVKAKSVKR